MSAFALEGMDNLKRIFEGFPEKAYRKPVIAAFRKAAEPVKKAMGENLPSNLKSLRKAIKIKPGKGRSLTLAVGFYAGQGVYRNTRGQQWDPYQLTYWHNYGTLNKRAASHTFKMPVRKHSAGRNGVAAQFFVEKAWDQSEGQVEKIFETTLEAEITKFFEKEAAK